MYLTPEEEKIYDGELGWAYQVSMRILVKLGDLFGASRLIPINSAHISGVSYKTIGDAPIDFLKALVETGGRARVNSTVNPSGFDLQQIEKMAISQEIKKKQLEIIDLYEKMSVNPILTCTPYYLVRPKIDSHLAWAESSAVIYANSILGAWTNREGGPSALAATLIGKTPDYGMHRAEEREANLHVKVKCQPRNEMEFGALGVRIGKIVGNRVPILTRLSRCTRDSLKQLGAGLASSGMTSIFYCSEEYVGKSLETISVEDKDIKDAIEKLSTTSENPDLVFLGCPHCSISEIQQIAHLIKGRRVREDVRLWVCTSRYVKAKAKRYVDIIEATGSHVLCDTCAVVTWIKELGVNTMMTNSAKTAYYAPTLNRVETIMAPIDQCIETACGE